VRGGGYKAESKDVKIIEVHSYGEAAVVVGVSTMTGKWNDADIRNLRIASYLSRERSVTIVTVIKFTLHFNKSAPGSDGIRLMQQRSLQQVRVTTLTVYREAQRSSYPDLPVKTHDP